jgi:hypothetical protein
VALDRVTRQQRPLLKALMERRLIGWLGEALVVEEAQEAQVKSLHQKQA